MSTDKKQHTNVSTSRYSTSRRPHAVEFLSNMSTHVKSYSTLNTYRSALSLLTSNELGKGAKLFRFFKGIAKLKPQKSRYSRIWVPDLVLQYLTSLYSAEEDRKSVV